MVLIWIIVSILVFSVIILVHEFWHFKASRIFWVKVEEFWLWIPPRAKKLFTDKHWTLYSLNWLPLWGFVRLKWENLNTFNIYDENNKLLSNFEAEKILKNSWDIYDNQKNKLDENIKSEILQKLIENHDKDSLQTKSTYKQAIIILAWIFMNFLLAIFIFSVLFFVWVKPIWINDSVKTSVDLKLIPNLEKSLEIWLIKENPWVYLSPAKDSIALKAWIKELDFVERINNIEIKKYSQFKDIVSKNAWKEIELKIKRVKNNCDTSKVKNCVKANITIKITPWNDWKIWAYLIPNYEKNENFEYKYWFFESIKYWVIETKNQIIFTFEWIKTLLRKIIIPHTTTERQEAINQVSWPIWMVDFMSKTIWYWISFILVIWAMISINLWVFNLLPIPALDWWRFVLIMINSVIKKIFGKKAINERVEWMIHVWFFIFLIALSIIIAYNDVNKIINN